MFAGEWRIATDDGGATLAIEPFETIPAAESPAVLEEGTRLLAFAAAGMEGRVVLRAPTS